ncbi:hypothetical protein SAY87_021751 [Trapa incisa]|uniref:Protein kinase domain-containing protein n=1 Tax=Trapa incisa TaxID=236973 RepID=A0AAN7JSF6_9MYRT|nr:hypothetical protein SAY87_021751 [Trapa incisa]
MIIKYNIDVSRHNEDYGRRPNISSLFPPPAINLPSLSCGYSAAAPLFCIRTTDCLFSKDKLKMACFSFLKRKPPFLPGHTVEIDEEVSTIQNTKLYSYKELRTATQNFTLSNKIGEGGFGSVYKGILRDGTAVAIKVLSEESRQGIREFLNEINVINQIEHENLVKLIGCCVEGKQRILVYEYLENNSLEQTLLGGSHSSMQFSWQTRCEICLGVAKGLAFLHEDVQPRIIHRDIKASNILLDRYLKPKISDFGLAKLFPANMTHISTRVAGTVGYLAPEYALRGQMNRKVDIYSFGVLVLEIVSGRCNTNRRLPPEDRYLLERIWKLHEAGELITMVDSSLGGDFDAEEAVNYLKIGLLCTQDTPILRPSMSTVVKMLTGEVKVNNEKITRPGLLSELLGIKVNSGKTDTKNSSEGISASMSGNTDYMSSSSGSKMTTSLPVTFSSI